MSSLASIVATDGALRRGDEGPSVLALQVALSQAGYRVGTDGDFGPRTEMVVRQFQQQHGLHDDAVVGAMTAAALDAPHAVLVATAVPVTTVISSGDSLAPWPHDDTASLLAFYNKPWDDASLLVHVDCPWQLYYAGKPWPHPVAWHRRGAAALKSAFDDIWQGAGQNNDSDLLKHVRVFDGTFNYRPVRGSSRLSCHAFGVAIDFDAGNLPLKHAVPATEMPAEIVQAFKKQGFFWGGDYTGRKDPMHFQLAHE